MVERRLRLRTDADVRRVRSRGRSFSDGPLVARILANPDTDPEAGPEKLPANRYAVIAGKKVGKAVQRNRCKRLVREAIRHLHPRVLPGHDIAIIIRGGVDELTGLAVAEASLTRIYQRARLLLPEAPTPSPNTTTAPESEQSTPINPPPEAEKTP